MYYCTGWKINYYYYYYYYYINRDPNLFVYITEFLVHTEKKDAERSVAVFLNL